MWPYDRNVSIALGVGTVVSAVACYYMYNNESGGGGAAAAASATTVAAEGVKAVNNVESKAWDLSRFFGIGKALAIASVTKDKVTATNNEVISS